MKSRHPLVHVAWCAIGVSAATVFFANLRFGNDVLAIGLHDDFFYYAQVARNLSLHGISSFDGIHLTNGYHPLWLLAVALLTKLFDIGGLFHASTVVPFAVALETTQFCLVIAIAYFALRVARVFLGVAASCCIQMLLAIFAMILVSTGMEVGLTLAVVFGLLWFRLRPGFEWTRPATFAYGLIAAVMVLSRLDSMLLAALLLVFDVLPNRSADGGRVRHGLRFCAGMWPVAVYVLSNELIFHTLLPISGTAKQLRLHHVPSLLAIRSITPYFAGQNFFLLGPCVLLALVALALLVSPMGTMWRGQRGVFGAMMLFPFLHLFTIVTLSDWRIWEWYLYPWPVAGMVAATMIFRSRRPLQEETLSLYSLTCFAASTVFLILYAALLTYYSGPRSNYIYLAAREISQFTESHPGLYAMGDRSGAVGYMANVPVIQLEGLMMGEPFLANIRAQRNLEDVLKQYGVRYYIATSGQAAPDADGCYTAKEPMQAGPDSPAMRAHICRTPVAVFQHGNNVNRIFDME